MANAGSFSSMRAMPRRTVGERLRRAARVRSGRRMGLSCQLRLRRRWRGVSWPAQLQAGGLRLADGARRFQLHAEGRRVDGEVHRDHLHGKTLTGVVDMYSGAYVACTPTPDRGAAGAARGMADVGNECMQIVLTAGSRPECMPLAASCALRLEDMRGGTGLPWEGEAGMMPHSSLRGCHKALRLAERS